MFRRTVLWRQRAWCAMTIISLIRDLTNITFVNDALSWVVGSSRSALLGNYDITSIYLTITIIYNCLNLHPVSRFKDILIVRNEC